MTTSYDSAKARVANQLLQDGASLPQALAGAGISSTEAGNYGLYDGQVVAAGYSTVSVTEAATPGNLATYGTAYTPALPALAGAGQLAQPWPYGPPDVVGGPFADQPQEQQFITNQPGTVPTVINPITGIQYDQGGFPVAASEVQPSTLNAGAGSVVGGYYYQTPEQDELPRYTSTVTDSASLYYRQNVASDATGTFSNMPVDVDPQVDPNIASQAGQGALVGPFVATPAATADTAGYPGLEQTNASILGAITAPGAVDIGLGAGVTQVGQPNLGAGTDGGDQGAIFRAQNSNVVREQRRNVNNRDWRVRLRLGPRTNYLYNDAAPGTILFPLQITDGVIFPYTPSVQTAYTANYSQYDLTHSNYRGYFYQGSNVGAIGISGMFTAQDTVEADYLLAVIHFLKTATKMFYGQDAQAGTPPPLMFLSGFGQYQFNEHPVLLQSFNYSLPNNVDYIRCSSVNQVGYNLLEQRNRTTTDSNPLAGAYRRLQTLFGNPPPGADPTQSQFGTFAPELGGNKPTYVPTQMEIQISLLPVQTRSQVSQQFSVKGFANGDLLQGGFW